jgi:hypothetical protein
MSPYFELVLFVLYNYIDEHLHNIRTYVYGPSVVPPTCQIALAKPALERKMIEWRTFRLLLESANWILKILLPLSV